MARARLTPKARARRYLQASMEAGYSGMRPEYRRAKLSLMREHERAYPRVREHALVGTRKHFDEPLSAGEREHQTHLRRQAGIEHPDAERIRRELDEEAKRPRSGMTAGPRAAASGASAAGGAIAGVAGGGNTIMYFVGVMLLLSLAYLLLASGEGSGAGKLVGGVVGVVTGGVRAFVAPVDPIATAERALGAAPLSAAAPPGGGAAPSSAPAGPGAKVLGGFATGSSSQLRRKDQGRDVQLKPGQAIIAPGAGEVIGVLSDPSGFGPDYPVERFTTGPYAGKEIYLGHTDSALKKGAKFNAGAILARTSRTGHNAPPGWAEIGYAHGGAPGHWGQRSPF